ncbi:MAG: hypothetical protein LBC56_05125 [Oscillospiraceae bacterium]|nr:hypothetical protein [Oscillospiraceae bacterium]
MSERKKYIIPTLILIIILALTSCAFFKSLFGGKKEENPPSGSSQIEQSSSREIVFEESPSQAAVSQETKTEKFEAAEKRISEAVNSLADLNSLQETVSSAEEATKEIMASFATVIQEADFNKDGKAQAAILKSGNLLQDIVLNVAVPVIEKQFRQLVVLGYEGSAADIVDKYGSSLEIVFVMKEEDVSKMTEFLKENGLRSDEHFVMVMNAEKVMSLIGK